VARHPSQRAEGEDGSAATELVIVFPAILLGLLLAFQVGLWYHARHVALAACEEGVRAARVETGSAEAGAARARRFLRILGPRIVANPTVAASRDQDVARVEVSGQALNVIPWLRLPIRQAAHGPVERFRGATQ
jgi:Flp pilus assembly protein TadG